MCVVNSHLISKRKELGFDYNNTLGKGGEDAPVRLQIHSCPMEYKGIVGIFLYIILRSE